MKDGKIKESQLSSSSYMKTERNKSGNCPHFSRPGSVGVFMVEDGMLHFDRNNFLQVDFRTKTKVEMVMKLKFLSTAPGDGGIGYRFRPFWSQIGYQIFGQVINRVGKITDLVLN